MNNTLQRYAPLLGRVLLSFIFIFAGFGKITGFNGTAGFMASMGLPFPELLLVATIVIEFVGGLMILLGWHARLAAATIFLFLIPVTVIFHNFWGADPAEAQNQMMNFMKNLSIMGGMLYILTTGSGAFSLDSKRTSAVTGKLAR